MADVDVDSAPRDLHTVKQFSSLYPAWTEPSLRDLIFHAEQNGLAEAGAVVRDRRRILLDPAGFFRWIADQQRKRRSQPRQQHVEAEPALARSNRSRPARGKPATRKSKIADQLRVSR